MTLEKQRYAIAEFLGTHTSKIVRKSWNPGQLPEVDVLQIDDKKGNRCLIWSDPCCEQSNLNFECPPDYPNDLNAMREASCRLSLTLRTIMFGHLYKMGGCVFETAFLSSQQHAEAFLRTVGQWEDSK